jgi:hypothetical protein
MHAFQHRPAPSSVEPVLDQEWAHGFCYIARQSRLWFGQDRREPVDWRPAVSLKREGDDFYVLPGTTGLNPAFFRLTSQDGLCQQVRLDTRDTYLCPRYEALSRVDLKETGVLHHPVRIRLMQWLRR